MAILGIQWLITAQLVLDLAAMAAALIARLEMVLLIVYLVWGTMLPFVELSLSGAVISIVAVGRVRGYHVALVGVQKDLIEARDWS